MLTQPRIHFEDKIFRFYAPLKLIVHRNGIVLPPPQGPQNLTRLWAIAVLILHPISTNIHGILRGESNAGLLTRLGGPQRICRPLFVVVNKCQTHLHGRSSFILQKKQTGCKNFLLNYNTFLKGFMDKFLSHSVIDMEIIFYRNRNCIVQFRNSSLTSLIQQLNF